MPATCRRDVTIDPSGRTIHADNGEYRVDELLAEIHI
jgi:hypothetical protein